MSLFKFFPFFLFFSWVVTITPVYAEDAEITTPPAPTIAASAYLLMSYDTGKVLAENNADVKLAPASLTKIMSVYVVFREISNGHLHLDDLVTISQKAWETLQLYILHSPQKLGKLGEVVQKYFAESY